MRDKPSYEHFRQFVSNASGLQQQLAERIASQIEFAEGFASLAAGPGGASPSQGTVARPAWLKRIGQARQIVTDCVAGGRLDRLKSAVAQAEEVLAPIGKAAKKYTMHCVGHGHIDMNWMWSWPETVAVTNDTFITMLKLMDEFPDFRFSQSQASTYEIARKYCPELWQQIRQRVAEGRWEVTAAHWVEGDKNLASGESLARHMLYTRRYMKEHFALEPSDVIVDWEPDTFGHAATIPSIVSRGGVQCYYMCRSGPAAKPPVFWWEGPDGRRVLVYLDGSWYNDHIGPHNAAAMLKFCGQTGLKDWMLVYGVGDHGGGPTRRDILRCHEMNEWPIFPSMRFSTAGQYYRLLLTEGQRFQTIRGELNFEFTGCYTSQSAIKRGNRYGENYCVEAETAAAIAMRSVKRGYPSDQLRDAWIGTLFGHFHDILPGSGVRATREYQSALFQETAAATSMIKTHSLRALAAQIDTSFAGGGADWRIAVSQQSTALGGGAGRVTSGGELSSAGHVVDGPRPLAVFNLLAQERQEVVTATIWDAHQGASAGDIDKKVFRVRYPDGRVLPAQRVNAGRSWGHHFVELALPVMVDSLGYAACSIEEGAAGGPAGSGAQAGAGQAVLQSATRGGERQPVGSFAIENEHLRAEFDNLTGGVRSLVDKATGQQFVPQGQLLGVLEYVLERPRGMTAWLINSPMRSICPLELVSLEAGAAGPHKASVIATCRVNDSKFTITYGLASGMRQLEITVQGIWLERGTRDGGTPALRMVFPAAVSDARGLYEIPSGSIERDAAGGQEVPALRWADIRGKLDSDRDGGLAILNDSKYGHSLDGSTCRLSLIRSSSDPDILPEIGEHTIKMAVVPHVGLLDASELMRLGAAFNHPLQVVATDVHAGRFAPQDWGLRVEPRTVIVTAVKKPEDGDGLIVNLLETAGKATTAKVSINPRLLGRVNAICESDFLEAPLDSSTAGPAQDGFTVEMTANGIASVRAAFEEQQ